ncbi:MAG: LysR substrate-binding domain-containing protein [Sneathiella sp.]
MQRKPTRPNDAHILSALPIFEAVHRLGSFTRAGAELGLTQSAVSRRIQALENILGVVLFSRRGRALKITEDGLRLGETALAALTLIEKTRQALGGPISGAIRIGVMNSLGALWLAPRLGRFVENNPDVSLTMTTIDSDFSASHKDPVTWDPSALDIVLTWGFGGWRALVARPFYREEMVPVCSSAFLKKNSVAEPEDIYQATRLIHTTRAGAWRTYAETLGLTLPAGFNEVQGSLAFEHFFMIREAAIAGAGIGLFPKLLVQEDLQQGRLIACAPAVRSGAHYAIVASQAALNRPAVAALVQWIEEEAKAVQ